jgi:hypothetical protein
MQQAVSTVEWRCRKGHVGPTIGLLFSAALLLESDNVPRERRYCFQCLIEALDKLGVSEVERVQNAPMVPNAIAPVPG